MKTVFRVECNVQAGYVEVTLDNLPLIPVDGMMIAPTTEADLLKVDGVYWMAGEPDCLEVWLVEHGDQVSPWSYFRKQGYKKGSTSSAKARGAA